MALPIPFPIPLGGGDEGIATSSGTPPEVERLAQYIKQKPNMLALVGVLSAQIDALSTAFGELDTDTRVDTALGAQLDTLGAIVGQPREGAMADDEIYRAHIKARIRINNASGTIPEILEIFDLIKDPGQTLELIEYAPAAFVLVVLGAVSEDVANAQAAVLRQAKAAGVRAILHWSPSASAETFRFDSGPGFDQGHLAGAII